MTGVGIQTEGGGGFVHDSSNKDSEKLNFGRILKEGPKGFADGLKECE